MKKEIGFVLAVLFVFALPGTFAISTDLKSSYQPGETIIIKISGNILEPIKMRDVLFKRGHVGISLEYNVLKIGGGYYIWANAPTSENNYTLEINNLATTVEGQARQITFEQNFSVLGNKTDYYIKPGAIYTSSDFEITAFLNEDIEKIIEINFISASDFVLKPGENKLSFSIDEIEETGVYNLTIGKYILPAEIIANVTKKVEFINASWENESIEYKNLSDEKIEDIVSAEEDVQESYYCIELKGDICGTDETCSGTGSKEIIARGEECCVGGECKKSAGGGSSWIGYLIAVIVVIGAIFAWIKFKKAKPAKTAIEKITGK